MKKVDPELLRKMMMGDYSAPLDDDKHGKGIDSSPKSKSNIDLHADRLFAGRKIAANDVLAAQMTALKDHLEDCQKNNIRKTIIIHGKGDGILRREVHLLLAKTNFVSSFSLVIDTPYFGGATRVFLK